MMQAIQTWLRQRRWKRLEKALKECYPNQKVRVAFESDPWYSVVAVAISLGNSQDLALTTAHELVVNDRPRALGTPSINLGPFSKKRCAALKEYLDRLAIHVE